MIFIEKFIIFMIHALSFEKDSGENRIKFRLLVFELLTLEYPGSMSAKIVFPFFNECVHAVA